MMTRTAPDIEGLEAFAALSDRRLTAFFVGREPEITFITQRVQAVASGHRSGDREAVAGSTVLITGVPGAGKTSLMRKLRQQWSSATGEEPFGVDIDISELGSAEGLTRAIRRASPAGSGGHWLAHVFSRFSSVNLDVLGTGLGVNLRDPGVEMEPINRPVVLFIDEIQTLPPDPRAAEVRLLRTLHLGTHGVPVVPVLAGLAHSTSVLLDASLNRLSPSDGLPLGPLSPEETAQAVEMFFDHFQVAGDRTGWPNTVTQWSDGWPMHVHNSLQSLAGELSRNGGDLAHIRPLVVKQRAAALRTSYYGQRTGDVFEEHLEVLGRVMAHIGSIRHKADIKRLLVEYGGNHPLGMEAEQAFRQMLARGIIQGDRNRVYRCPIPSLASWMACGGSPLHQEVMRGDAEGVVELLAAGVDPAIRDLRGRTALQLAREEGWADIARILESAADPKDDQALRSPFDNPDPNGGHQD